MRDHEELRLQHVADMQRMAPVVVDRLDWPAQPPRRAPHSRAAGPAACRRRAVPWHRRRLAGIDIDRVDEAAWRLPVMTKDDLMGHFDEIVTDDRLDLDAIEAHLDA